MDNFIEFENVTFSYAEDEENAHPFFALGKGK